MNWLISNQTGFCSVMNIDDYRDTVIIKDWGTSIFTSINKIVIALVCNLSGASSILLYLVTSALVDNSINLCW